MAKLKRDYLRVSKLGGTYILHTAERVEVSRRRLATYEDLISLHTEKFTLMHRICMNTIRNFSVCNPYRSI